MHELGAALDRMKTIVSLILCTGVAVAGSTLQPAQAGVEPAKKRVVVWSEGTAPKRVYPNDVNGAIAEALQKLLPNWNVVTASLGDPEQGVNDQLLESTDVMIWFGHLRHANVETELAEKIAKRVKEEGMGFIALHSACISKPFQHVIGTRGNWARYYPDKSSAKITVALPEHPVCKGVTDFELPIIERYTEPFNVPEPEAVPLQGEYTAQDGTKANARMGLCWTMGKGRVFYFTPGHEPYGDFLRDDVRNVIANAVEWAAGQVEPAPGHQRK